MLDQEMGSPDLALRYHHRRGFCDRRRVVVTNVDFEHVRVGALGRFPARDLVDRVEVVREVFAGALADFPVRGKASLRLVLDRIPLTKHFPHPRQGDIRRDHHRGAKPSLNEALDGARLTAMFPPVSIARGKFWF
jgi:hypothetical protein